MAERWSGLRAFASAHVHRAQSVGVYSERVRVLRVLWAERGGWRWRAHLCVRPPFCPLSAAGDGLPLCLGSLCAAMLARKSAARVAASTAASVPGMMPLLMFAAGQCARDIACDRATSSSGSRCSGGASRVRLGEGGRELSRSRTLPGACCGLGEGEGERERAGVLPRACCGEGEACEGLGVGEVERGRAVSRSCSVCGAPSMRGCVGAGEGERGSGAACPRPCCGAPGVCGGGLRFTAAPENPGRRGPRGSGLCLCPCLSPCSHWVSRLPSVCGRF
jgi:hypothetical protein